VSIAVDVYATGDRRGITFKPSEKRNLAMIILLSMR
jgi:hypothetical protein